MNSSSDLPEMMAIFGTVILVHLCRISKSASLRMKRHKISGQMRQIKILCMSRPLKNLLTQLILKPKKIRKRTFGTLISGQEKVML